MEDKHKYDINVENYLATLIIDGEYKTSNSNKTVDNNDFDASIDMLECIRSEKNVDWMSDIFLPEFPSILMTAAGGWANQYFKTRDFIEVKLEGDNPKDIVKARGAKKLINKTLNQKDIYHYHKYIRGRLINALAGQVYAVCWWEQEVKQVITGYQPSYSQDADGNLITSPKPIYGEKVITDRFNYDIVDPRNVFTTNEYSYSIQEKSAVIIRSEKTYEELAERAEANNYINLDIVKELIKGNSSAQETQTSQETYNKDDKKQKDAKPASKTFDTLERFGKMWCKVTERDENGDPVSVEPAYDTLGALPDNAELLETIITFAVIGSTKVLVRFQLCPYKDSKGRHYRPIIRGWCYIHPTKDTGLSDGKYLRELQVALNDTFNLSNDRVKLATMPTLIGRKYALEDNQTIYFEPEHVMEVEDPMSDLRELVIKDDVSGALNQMAMLKNSMHQISAKFPTTMGDVPENSSTTATAVVGADNKAGLRDNFTDLTFEYTFLIDLYQMILNMSYQYMRPETALQVMGDDAYEFDPDADYSYTPLSQNIENEYNKYRKITLIDQMLGRVSNVPNPNTAKLLNYLLSKAFELLGDNFPDYKNHLLDESYAPPEQGGQTAGNQPTDMGSQPTSNQSGMPMSNMEQYTRGV
ncbi:MAG: hypothetical protein A2W23_03150 [Planctomycetes bacterium RBG_16_43_13]|nr:MAG: hypothetical protein A2W23_03150 [Planctomycetes bacterium RBG_16_43_13]